MNIRNFFRAVTIWVVFCFLAGGIIYYVAVPVWGGERVHPKGSAGFIMTVPVEEPKCHWEIKAINPNDKVEIGWIPFGATNELKTRTIVSPNTGEAIEKRIIGTQVYIWLKKKVCE